MDQAEQLLNDLEVEIRPANRNPYLIANNPEWAHLKVIVRYEVEKWAMKELQVWANDLDGRRWFKLVSPVTDIEVYDGALVGGEAIFEAESAEGFRLARELAEAWAVEHGYYIDESEWDYWTGFYL